MLPTSYTTSAARRPVYDATTLAMDAMAAAGLMVRGCDVGTFDPMRAALAAEHAPLVRSCGRDVGVLASRIREVLEHTSLRAEARVLADQAALRNS